jgi:hypothetical protein
MAEGNIPKPPFSFTGGCLCGAIRYTITYPADATDWPPYRNSTCQCTRCRKTSGGLWVHGFTLPTSYFSPPLQSNPAFKSYQVSSETYWSWCADCGSRLCVNEGTIGNGGGGETYLYIGSLDESVLCGEKGEDGKRTGGEIGKILGKPLYHGWLDNAILGVTDTMEGKKHCQNSGMSGP